MMLNRARPGRGIRMQHHNHPVLAVPGAHPQAPTAQPTRRPTTAPTTAPTKAPTTSASTAAPTTAAPTSAPTTAAPTTAPTAAPTGAPSLFTDCGRRSRFLGLGQVGTLGNYTTLLLCVEAAIAMNPSFNYVTWTTTRNCYADLSYSSCTFESLAYHSAVLNNVRCIISLHGTLLFD